MKLKRKLFGTAILLLATQVTAQAQAPVAVTVDGKPLQVMNMDAQGRVPWGGSAQIGNAVRSESDGAANTKAIIAAVGSNAGHGNKPYAAALCSELKANGQEDWYLPSVNELKGLQQNLKAIGLGEKNTYWSSTEVNGTQSATVYMLSGALYNVAKVNDNHYVCVRRAR